MAKPTGTRGDKTPSPSAAALPPAAGKPNSSQAPKAPEPAKDTQASSRPAPPAPRAAVKESNQAVTDGERRRRIAEAAYYRAERRGFTPGGEHDDWLEAEQEVDRGTPTDLPLEDNKFPSPK